MKCSTLRVYYSFIFIFRVFSLRKAMKKLNGDSKLIADSNEIKLLRKLHHQNIIKYFEDFTHNGSMYIIFENCEVTSFIVYIYDCYELIIYLSLAICKVI